MTLAGTLPWAPQIDGPRRTFDLNTKEKALFWGVGNVRLLDRLLGAHPGWIELLRFDVAKVLKDLFPPLAEQPRLVPATPPLLDVPRIHRVIIVSRDTSEIIEQFDHFLY